MNQIPVVKKFIKKEIIIGSIEESDLEPIVGAIVDQNKGYYRLAEKRGGENETNWISQS